MTKHRLGLAITALLCIMLALPLVAAQEDESNVDVTYTVGYGGLLWVNGTNVLNNSVVSYPNNTLLMLSATPTNANYSYSSMLLNGTLTTDNPAFYNLTSTEANSTQTISVSFVAEAEPTVDPDAITSDDAFAIGAVALIFAVALPCAFFVLYKKKSDDSD